MATQLTPALVRRVVYHPWLGMWVPQVVLSYPQWDLKEVTCEAPVLGQLAWVVNGHPTCPGCGSQVDHDTIPALIALCPQCQGRVAHDSWTCCERVITGQPPLCTTPLHSPPCVHPVPYSSVVPFATTSPCFERHDLVALWFAPGRARIGVIPSSRVGAFIAASGALVARRYLITGRMTFLEDWEMVLTRLRESTLHVGTLFCSLPSHREISEESSAALAFFTEKPASKKDEVLDVAHRDFFTPLEAILLEHHVHASEESLAQQRYFLPRRLPRRRSSLDALSHDGLLAVLGTCVGAWGPWFFLRKLDGTIAQINFSALLGRLVTDSPALFPGLEPSVPSLFDENLVPDSTADSARLVSQVSSPVGTDSFPDSDGGE